MKATYGTGSSLMMLTPSSWATAEHLARTVAWSTADGAHFALEGNIAMSGAAVQWVGEFLGLAHPIEDAAALAATVPDAAGLDSGAGDGRARRAVLGRDGARPREQSRALAHGRASGPSRGRRHCVSSCRCSGSHGRRRHGEVAGAAGRWRRHAQRCADADAGRHSWPARASIDAGRSLGARRGLAGWSGAGLVALAWKSWLRCRTSVQVFEPQNERTPNANRLRGAWRLAVRRARLTAERAA